MNLTDNIEGLELADAGHFNRVRLSTSVQNYYFLICNNAFCDNKETKCKNYSNDLVD